MSKNKAALTFERAQYVGFTPGEPDRGYHSKKATTIEVTDVQIKMPGFWSKKQVPILWQDVASVSFDSGRVRKSRKGKALARGIVFAPLALTALAAPKDQMAAEIIFEMKDGVVGNHFECFEVARISGGYARRELQPFMDAHSIPCLDDEVGDE